MSTTPSNPVQSCQPSSMELVTTLRDMRTPLACEAADEISGLREANHHYRDSAARDEGLIATLMARVEELETALATEKEESASYHKFWIAERDRAARLETALRQILNASNDPYEIARAVLQPKGTV